MKLSQIPRNDVDAALAYVEQQLDSPAGLSSDDARVLLRLQDKPDRYISAFAALMKKREAAGMSVV